MKSNLDRILFLIKYSLADIPIDEIIDNLIYLNAKYKVYFISL